jgi:hypothetical protein
MRAKIIHAIDGSVSPATLPRTGLVDVRLEVCPPDEHWPRRGAQLSSGMDYLHHPVAVLWGGLDALGFHPHRGGVLTLVFACCMLLAAVGLWVGGRARNRANRS